MTTIRQITEKGLEKARQTVQITRKTLKDGSANPSYEIVLGDLAEMERHFAAKNEVVALAAKQGLRRNSYPGTCVVTGAEVQEGCGFARKNDSGKWEVLSFPAVQELVGFRFE